MFLKRLLKSGLVAVSVGLWTSGEIFALELLQLGPNGGYASGLPFTPYSFSFQATGAQSRVTFEFQNEPSFWLLDAVTLAPTGNSGMQLLTNGGFESGNLTGWTPFGSSFGAVRTEGRSQFWVVPPQVYLPPEGAYLYTNGAITFGGIYQDVITSPGQIYSLNFFLAASDAGGDNDSLVKFKLTVDNASAVPDGWSRFDFTAVAGLWCMLTLSAWQRNRRRRAT